MPIIYSVRQLLHDIIDLYGFTSQPCLQKEDVNPVPHAIKSKVQTMRRHFSDHEAWATLLETCCACADAVGDALHVVTFARQRLKPQGSIWQTRFLLSWLVPASNSYSGSPSWPWMPYGGVIGTLSEQVIRYLKPHGLISPHVDCENPEQTIAFRMETHAIAFAMLLQCAHDVGISDQLCLLRSWSVIPK
ncbi:hypothetical protein CC86DRAFT_46709 [Ophiobolus disseminans]|uniref:Uncharacterized protein n=1 Tax=Ophiobolus disseminans TaxID=1469910 RepID=A0A6A6ZW31_9PLEO|nr:hypothetical protein CC86DRAFT_46709 [Ophiobolus disseminans]